MALSAPETPWRHALRAAAVGGGLTALWIVIVWVAYTSPVCQGTWTCGILLIFGYWAIPAVGAVVAWPVMRWVGVRPAWLIVLVGAVVAMLGVMARDGFGFSPTLTSPWLAPIVAVAYAVAAWVVVARVPLQWRVLPLVLALLPWPVVELTAGARAASAQQQELVRAGVPLLGPDLPAGYVVRRAGTEGGTQRELFYRLEPASIGTTPDLTTEENNTIWVIVAPTSPTFAPPDRCTVAGTTGTQDYRPPCPQVADNVWRWNNGDYVSYFVRKGDVMVAVERTSANVPEDLLKGITRTLAPRDPSYFTD